MTAGEDGPHRQGASRVGHGRPRSDARPGVLARAHVAAAHRTQPADHQPGQRRRLPGLRVAGTSKRHFSEYCENGAKHVNDEATTRRITRDFFREHPVSVLATKSDMWLNDQAA